MFSPPPIDTALIQDFSKSKSIFNHLLSIKSHIAHQNSYLPKPSSTPKLVAKLTPSTSTTRGSYNFASANTLSKARNGRGVSSHSGRTRSFVYPSTTDHETASPLKSESKLKKSPEELELELELAELESEIMAKRRKLKDMREMHRSSKNSYEEMLNVKKEEIERRITWHNDEIKRLNSISEQYKLL